MQNGVDYLKLFHNNGRKLKIAGSRDWAELRVLEEVDVDVDVGRRSEHVEHIDLERLAEGESLSVEMRVKGQLAYQVTEKSWSDLRRVVDEKIGQMGDADAIPHVVLAFGLLVWAVFMITFFPIIGGG